MVLGKGTGYAGAQGPVRSDGNRMPHSMPVSVNLCPVCCLD